MIGELNLIVRLISVGASLVILAVVLPGSTRRPLKVALTGLLLGTIAYVIHSEHGFALPRRAEMWSDLLSLFTPFWTWLFARRLFEREPDQRITLGLAGFLLLCWISGYFALPERSLGFYGIHLASLVLMADLFRCAWIGRDDDLIERRRAIRTWLPLAIAVQAAAILGFELVGGMDKPAPEVQLANAMLILGLTLFASSILLRAERTLLVDSQSADPPRRPRSPDELSPSERVLFEKLEAEMASGFYRTPGLTIAMLAARLDTPEHRLRALINRRLGHRNFSAYLNLHRIAEAKVALADKARVDLPVLTIAMDLGYNSLPTFNRAFRETAGCTPTEYRRDAIGQD